NFTVGQLSANGGGTAGLNPGDSAGGYVSVTNNSGGLIIFDTTLGTPSSISVSAAADQGGSINLDATTGQIKFVGSATLNSSGATGNGDISLNAGGGIFTTS